MRKNAFLTLTVVVSLLSSLLLPITSPIPIQAAPPLPPTPTPTRPPVDPGSIDQSAHTPPAPDANLSAPDVEDDRVRTAMEAVLQKYLNYWGPRYETAPLKVSVEGEWAHGVAEWLSAETLLKEPLHILAHRTPDGAWQAVLPSSEGMYLQWLDALPVNLVTADAREQMRAQATKPGAWRNSTTPGISLIQPAPLFDSETNRVFRDNPIQRTSTPVSPNTFEDAFRIAAEDYALNLNLRNRVKVEEVRYYQLWAYAIGQEVDTIGQVIPYQSFVMLGRYDPANGWHVLAPYAATAREYNHLLSTFPTQFIDESTKAYLHQPESGFQIQNFNGHKLPWPAEQSGYVTKKDGSGHESQVDFDIRGSGTSGDVYASKPGTVVFVKESSSSTCQIAPPDPCWKKANMVVVQHADGEYSWYVHLANNSVPVSVGDNIGFGTKIGVEGQTGYSFGVHLHYMGSSGHTTWTNPTDPDAAPWATGISAVDFSESSWADLVVGQSYISQNGAGSGGACPGPSLGSPADGQVLSNRTVAFNWQALAGCNFNGYTFRVKNVSNMDAGGTQIIDTGEGGTSRTESFGAQWDNQDLYWGVKAANAPNGASWSVRRFRIEPNSPPACTPSADQVALYVDPNYGGQCTVKGIGDYANPSAIGLPNDAISSIKVGSNVKANLCHDDNYAGGCETFLSDDANLSDNSIGNDQVSSVKVESRNTACTPGADQIALYVDANYGGQCVVKGIGDYSNPSAIGLPNDAISSIRVGGSVKAILYRDDNYASDAEEFTNDDNDLGNNGIGSDQVSSAKVQWRVQLPSSPPLQNPGNGSSFNEGANLNLAWSATGNEYYGEIWGGPGGLLTFGWRTGTSENIGSQWAGYTYSWHVKARNSAGESGWSSTWTFIVRPGAPSNLTVQTPSCNQANLYWNDNSGNEEGYKIYRDGAYIAQVGAGVTSYQNAGLNGNTAYTYHVKAYRGDVESDASNIVSITTPACPPPQPDLVPSQWSAWQYPVVPASITGTVMVNALYAGLPTYIDWGITNSGGTSTGGNTYGDLYLDSIRIGHFDFGNVEAGWTWAFFDWWETIDTPGWHTLKFIADPDNLIVESNETNNVFERQFYWRPVAPYQDDMESGATAWVATGLWHQVDETNPYPAAHTPTHSWWYGQDATGNYDTGNANSGTLTSLPVYLPTTGFYLRFWYRYETETQSPNWDQRWLQIAVDEGPFNNVLQLYDDPEFWWLQSQAIDLSGYAGHSIQVRFFFDTLDGLANNYRGWYIDDVDISTTPPPSCADPYEPNNTAAQAAAMAYGQTLNADICAGGDYDWYTFSGAAGDQAVVDIDARVNGSPLDSYLFLVDSDGQTVLAENDDEITYTVQDAHLGYTLPHTGTYFLKVRAWNHPSVGGPDYFYSIRLINDQTAPTTAQIVFPEGGTWLRSTTTISVTASDSDSGIRSVEFLWHSADWVNSDWVWLGADQDGRDGWSWNFDASGLSDQQGMALYSFAFDWGGNSRGAGVWGLGLDRVPPTTTLSLAPPYAGAPFRDFYVWWTGSDNLSGVANYDVQYRDGLNGVWTDLLLNASSTNYHFIGDPDHTYYFRARARDYASNESAYAGGDGDAQYTVQVCPTPPDAYESDNTFAGAQVINTAGLTQTHTIHVEGDQDWVKFYAAAGVTYTLATTNTGGHADTVLSLYGITGTEILASNDDYPGLGLASRLDWLPTLSGTYYAQINHWDPWAYGCTTEYGMSIVTNDGTSPTGSVIIDNGNTYAPSVNTTLTLAASDEGTGVEQMMLSNNSEFAGAAWVTYTTSFPWTLPGGDGPKVVYARFRDRAGNNSIVYTDTIVLDATAPTGSIVINNSDAYAASTNVTLTLSATDAGSGMSQMMISNESTFMGASWIAYETSINWVLLNNDGARTVYVKFRDQAGNTSAAYNDTIVLDTTSPTGSLVINNGAAYAASTNVTLTLSANDPGSGVTLMMIGNNSSFPAGTWVTYTTPFTWLVPSGDGAKAVYVKFQDQVGNVSGSYYDLITLDTQPPSGTVLINNGNAYANSTNVTLLLAAADSSSGVSQVMVSNSSDFAGAPWTNFTPSLNWTIPSGDGMKTVYVKYRDQAGNISDVTNDTIVLDTDLPTGSIVINDDDVYATSSSVTLSLPASDPNSGIAEMMIANRSDFAGATWAAYSPTSNWTLTTGDGLKTVYAKFRDQAGNASTAYSDDIIFDVNGPTGNVSINDSATATASPAVTLSLSADDAGSGVTQMILSNTPGFTGASWQTFAPSLSWLLLSGDGVQTVYAKFRDQLNHESTVYSDIILLDTMAPQGDVVINGNNGYASSHSVTLTLSALDSGSGVSQVMLANDAGFASAIWQPYVTSVAWTLSIGDGIKIVYAKFRDQVGNASAVVSATIVMDTIAPTGSVTIEGGAATVTHTAVSLAISGVDANGVTEMRLRSDAEVWGAWESFAATRSWALPLQAGEHTIWIQFRDAAGNVSASYSDSIAFQWPFNLYLPLVLRNST